MSSSFGVAMALCLLALLDAGFAGFRASVGRDARLVDHRFNVVSALWGMGIGLVGLLLIAATTVPWLTSESTRSARLRELTRAGDRMLAVYGPMAAVNLLAIALYLLATSHEVRAVAMTLVLGPFTLLRPVVIAAGALAAAIPSHLAAVRAGSFVAFAAAVAVGPTVGWWRFRRLSGGY